MDSLPHQELWLDLDTNKSYLVREGHSIEIDGAGHSATKFVPYCSGTASTRYRTRLVNDSLRPRGAKSPQICHVATLRPALTPKVRAAGSFYRPGTSRLRGSDMFPRPLSVPYRNVMCVIGKSRNSGWTMAGGAKTLYSASPTKPTNMQETCSFFTTPRGKRPASSCLRSDCRPKTASSPTARASARSETEKFMRPRQTANGSFLKLKYVAALKQTFVTFRRPDSREAGLILQSSVADEEEPEDRPQLEGRSFMSIREDLRQEEAGEDGRYNPPEERLRPISCKGIYSIRLPTEGELYRKAQAWRKRMNPQAAEIEAKRVSRELFLFAKKKKQSELTYKVMQSIMRSRSRREEYKKPL